MDITLQSTASGKNFLKIVFGVDPQDLSSEVRIALSPKEHAILAAAEVPASQD